MTDIDTRLTRVQSTVIRGKAACVALLACFIAAVIIAAAKPGNAAPAPAAVSATKPSTKPAKPPTYAELKAEVESLRAENARLRKELDKLRPQQPVVTVVRIGMTRAELDAMDIKPDHINRRASKDGITETYYYGLSGFLKDVTLRDGVVVEISR